MAEFSFQALHDEVVNDPAGLGYPDIDADQDALIVELINATTGPGAATITRKVIEPHEIFDSIPYAEYMAYDAPQREWLDTMLELAGGAGVIDGTDPVVWSNLIAAFPAGSDARFNVLAKIQRTGSRGEVLWGEGTVITLGDVGQAANL